MSTAPTPDEHEPDGNSGASPDQSSNSDVPRDPAKYTYGGPAGFVTGGNIVVYSIKGSRMLAAQRKKGIKTIYTYGANRPNDPAE